MSSLTPLRRLSKVVLALTTFEQSCSDDSWSIDAMEWMQTSSGSCSFNAGNSRGLKKCQSLLHIIIELIGDQWSMRKATAVFSRQ